MNRIVRGRKDVVGHELYYKTDERHIGSVSIRRWQEVSKLLPLLVDFVNRAQQQESGSGVARNVTVFAGGVAAPPAPPPEQNAATRRALRVAADALRGETGVQRNLCT